MKIGKIINKINMKKGNATKGEDKMDMQVYAMFDNMMDEVGKASAEEAEEVEESGEVEETEEVIEETKEVKYVEIKEEVKEETKEEIKEEAKEENKEDVSEEKKEKARKSTKEVLQKFLNYIRSDRFIDRVSYTSKKYDIPKKIVKNQFIAMILGKIADVLHLTITITAEVIKYVVEFITAIINRVVDFCYDVCVKLTNLMTLGCGSMA